MGFLSNMLVRLGLDPGDFNQGMDKATRSVNRFGQDMENTGRRMATAITLPLAGLAAVSLKAAADMEALKMGLTAITKSSSETERQLASLKEVAKLPGLGFAEAVKGSINLQAAGFSAQLAERSLRAFGNALATVGKGRADLEGVNLVLTQIVNKPKVMAQDLNQLRERLPQISIAMKAAFGSSVSEDIQKLGVTGQQFVETMISEFEKMPPVTGGLKNSIENLQDSAFQAFAAIGEGLRPMAERFIGMLEGMADKARAVGEAFSKLPKGVQDTAIGVGVLAAGLPLVTIALGATITNAIAVAGAFTKITSLGASLAVGIGTRLYGALALASSGMTALSAASAAAAATGVFALSVAIVQVTQALWAYRRAQEEVSDATATRDQAMEMFEKRIAARSAEAAARVKELSDSYHSGRMGAIGSAEAFEKYRRSLQALADTLPPATANQKAHTKATTEAAGAHEAATKFLIGEAIAQEALEAASKRSLQMLLDYATGTKKVELATSDLRDMTEALRSKLREVHIPLAQIVEIKVDPLKNSIIETDRVMEKFGLTSTRAARQFYDSLIAARTTIAELAAIGKASWDDVAKLDKAIQEAHDRMTNTTRATAEQAAKSSSTVLRQVSTAITDMGRSLTDVVFRTKTLADAFKDLGKTIVRIILENVIANGINKLMSALSGVLSHLGSIGKALGGLFGGAASSAGSVAGGAAGAAGAGGSLAGGAGKAAGGLAGTLTAIGSIGSMVSGFIGNFQNARMEGTMNAVELNTRKSAIYLGEGAESIHQFTKNSWLTLVEIKDYMWKVQAEYLRQINDTVTWGKSKGNGSGVVVNFYGPVTGDPNAIANAIFDHAALAGA